MLTREDLENLANKQRKLDEMILKKHNLENDTTITQKCLIALCVEVSEMANEEKSFKFWSDKTQDRNKILEEYADGIFFFLSLANKFGQDLNKYNAFEYWEENEIKETEITEFYSLIFMDLGNLIKQTFYKDGFIYSRYNRLLSDYLAFGSKLGFTREMMLEAYEAKLKINYERQGEAYKGE